MNLPAIATGIARAAAFLKGCLCVLFFFCAAPALVAAQDLEPRAYSRAPVGTQNVVVTYNYQSGDILTDAALPLQDVAVSLNSGAIGYTRIFGLFGKQAAVSVFLPYIHGRVSGRVFEEQQEVTRSGVGDVRLRFSTLLIGAPALKPKEFAARKPKTVVGVSLTVVPPTGQYDPARLINIGSNRWSFKPEVGISKPIGRWTVEGAGGVLLFTNNNRFFGGSVRKQDPILTLQSHVVYTFRPRMWVAVSGTLFRGGRTTVNNRLNNDLQSNSRLGATFSYPFGPHHSLKAAWMRGLTTRIGGKLNSLSFGWQYTWF